VGNAHAREAMVECIGTHHVLISQQMAVMNVIVTTPNFHWCFQHCLICTIAEGFLVHFIMMNTFILHALHNLILVLMHIVEIEETPPMESQLQGQGVLESH